MLNKLIVVFGTRPEAIKMAPVIIELRKYYEVVVCVTGQHRDMLDQVLKLFDINPDYDLNIMKSNQALSDVTTRIITGFTEILHKESPDIVLVHGDTTTTLAASISAFYSKITVAHVEAGLRTHDVQSPFPEEFNRVATAIIADIHFAPTKAARNNLINEGVNKDNIFVTGNTVIDSMYSVLKSVRNKSFNELCNNQELEKIVTKHKELILVTGHRRENFGSGIESICRALVELSELYPDIVIVYPVHFNPNVKIPVHRILSDIDNIYLINPLGYSCFIKLMDYSCLIITDSGGIQEEAPSLGKHVLVTREKTERNESFPSGLIQLVGTNKELIVKSAVKIIDSNNIIGNIDNENPFGDGNASKKIRQVLSKIKI